MIDIFAEKKARVTTINQPMVYDQNLRLVQCNNILNIIGLWNIRLGIAY